MDDRSKLVVSAVSMDRALVCKGAPNEIVGANVEEELEQNFRALIILESETRLKKKEIINKIVNNLIETGVREFDSGCPIYDKFYLWFIKYERFDMTGFKMEENRMRFQSMYEFESAYPSLTITSTKIPILLKTSRECNRTPAENEMVTIHKSNLKAYLNMVRPIKNALKSAAVLALPDVETIKDDTIEDTPSHTYEYKYLLDLVADYSKLLRDYDTLVRNRLQPGACLSDIAINLYLERILQPLSDSTGQNILVFPSEFYEQAKTKPKKDLTKHFKKYVMENVDKFVLICYSPGHWYTILIEYDWRNGHPKINFMDSMSTQEPFGENATCVLRIIEVFSELFGVEPSAWVKTVPLRTILQSDGVNCGVWAILFAESCFKGFKSLEELIHVDIVYERDRIAKKVEGLLDWATYYESFTQEGILYVTPNPPSSAYIDMKDEIKTDVPQHSDMTALSQKLGSMSITKKRKMGQSLEYSSFKRSRATEDRIPLARGVKLREVEQLHKPPDSPESTALPDELVAKLSDENEMGRQHPPATTLDRSKTSLPSTKLYQAEPLEEESFDDDIPLESLLMTAREKEIVSEFTRLNEDYLVASNNLTDLFWVRFDSTASKSAKENLYWEMIDFHEFVMEKIDRPYHILEKKKRKLLPDSMRTMNRYTELRDIYYDLFNEYKKAIKSSIPNFNQNKRLTKRKQFHDVFRGVQGPESAKRLKEEAESGSARKKHDSIRGKMPAPIVMKDAASSSRQHEDTAIEDIVIASESTTAEVEWSHTSKNVPTRDAVIEDANAVEEENASSRDAVEEEIAPSRAAMEDDDAPSRVAMEDDDTPTRDAVEEEIAPTRDAVEDDDAPSRVAMEDDDTPTRNAVEEEIAPTRDAVEEENASSRVAMEDDDTPTRDAMEEEIAPTRDAVEDDDASSRDAVEEENAPSRDAMEDDDAPSRDAAKDYKTPAKDDTIVPYKPGSSTPQSSYFSIEQELIRNQHTIELTKRIESEGIIPYTLELPTIPLIGLPNLGTNCYFNAVIQIIFRINCFKAMLIDEQIMPPERDRSHTLLYHIRNIFEEYISGDIMRNTHKGKSVVVSAAVEYLKDHMNLPPGEQWDASEFMIMVLSQLHKETRMPYVKRTSLSIPLNDQSNINLILSTAKHDWNHYLTCERVSPIMENFCFQLMCRYKCSTVLEDGTRCGGTDVAYEYQTSLLLNVHPRSLRNAVQDGPPNILQLIEKEFSPKELSYRCSKCDKFQCGSIEKEFVRTPKTLIITLNRRVTELLPKPKRGRGKGKSSQVEPEDKPEDFPIPVLPVLDITSVSFVGIKQTNKMIYDTFVGMAVHKGRHWQRTGHYVALVAHEGSYKIIDDLTVHSEKHPITEATLQKRESWYNGKSNICVYE